MRSELRMTPKCVPGNPKPSLPQCSASLTEDPCSVFPFEMEMPALL